jgi:hypothetical protein
VAIAVQEEDLVFCGLLFHGEKSTRFMLQSQALRGKNSNTIMRLGAASYYTGMVMSKLQALVDLTFFEE